MARHSLITVLIPAFDEQLVLPALFERLETLVENNKNYQFEFLFVNDGSRDDTMNMIAGYSQKNSAVSFINLSRNFGKEIAMIAGLDYAKGDAVIIIDADLQDPPELIPEMIEFWRQGFDDVYAKRRSRKGESWLKKTTSNLYYKLLQATTHVEIQSKTGDFRLLDRKVVEALKQHRESQRNTKALFSLVGFRKKEILYDRDERAAGKTKWNYRKLSDLAVDGITSFTTAPLRIAFFVGLFVSVGAAIYIVYLLIRPLFGVSTGDGYSSLMVAILFMGGVQLISLGIIGEYVGKIFKETKNRPLYMTQEYHESKTKKPR